RPSRILLAAAGGVVIVRAAANLVIVVDPVQPPPDADQKQAAALVPRLVSGKAALTEAVPYRRDEVGGHEPVDVPGVRHRGNKAIPQQLAHPERVREAHDELTVTEDLGVRADRDGPSRHPGAVTTDHDPAVVLHTDDA